MFDKYVDKTTIPPTLLAKSYLYWDISRWSFDIACAHLFYLMTSDSYSRYVQPHLPCPDQCPVCQPHCNLNYISGTLDLRTIKNYWKLLRKKLASPLLFQNYHQPSNLLARVHIVLQLSWNVSCVTLQIQNPLWMTFKMPNLQTQCAIILVIDTVISP